MTHLNELHEAAFNPETIRILSDALDDAWRRLEAGARLNGSADAARAALAKYIITMANRGERDRQRLTEGALQRLRL